MSRALSERNGALDACSGTDGDYLSERAKPSCDLERTQHGAADTYFDVWVLRHRSLDHCVPSSLLSLMNVNRPKFALVSQR